MIRLITTAKFSFLTTVEGEVSGQP